MVEQFWKLFPEFMEKLESISDSKQTKVILHFLKNLSDNNQYTDTIKGIADKTGISYGTVKHTMYALLDKDIIRLTRHASNVYFWNPNLLMKGPAITKLKLVAEYEALDKSKRIRSRNK